MSSPSCCCSRRSFIWASCSIACSTGAPRTSPQPCRRRRTACLCRRPSPRPTALTNSCCCTMRCCERPGCSRGARPENSKKTVNNCPCKLYYAPSRSAQQLFAPSTRTGYPNKVTKSLRTEYYWLHITNTHIVEVQFILFIASSRFMSAIARHRCRGQPALPWPATAAVTRHCCCMCRERGLPGGPSCGCAHQVAH